MPEEPKQLKKPVDWDELYPGRFMKGGQLGDKRPVLTISDVDLEKLMGDDGGEKIKGVISFRETDLKLPLNKTNGTCIKAMLGRDVRTWVGKQIVLFQGEWKGQPAVRVYGSPHLEREMQVEIKLPKRRPLMMTMHAPTRRAVAAPAAAAAATPPAASAPPREPGDDDDGGPKEGRLY